MATGVCGVVLTKTALRDFSNQLVVLAMTALPDVNNEYVRLSVHRCGAVVQSMYDEVSAMQSRTGDVGEAHTLRISLTDLVWSLQTQPYDDYVRRWITPTSGCLILHCTRAIERL